MFLVCGSQVVLQKQKMNKIIHGPNVAGQSLADRVLAAKHTITGQDLTKAVFKATTEEVMGPKRKHLDCK